MSDVRCFVAADLPAEVQADLGRLQERLRGQGLACRWVAPETMHLTLTFFGHLAAATFEAVRDVLASPLGLGGPLRIELAGVGAFPAARRARVIWAGLEGDVAGLARAALTVEARSEAVGIPREARPFRGHITLARARSPAGIQGAERALASEADYRGPAFSVGELVLYESHLRPEGPQYLRRLTIPL